ncbi:restriction endonuclease subunit S [Streptomyces monashensis]|uniref:restriction endonuclease subunit S n=1 Tax=Streptomyces monashensis TaxID=1678012 RepID=UPI000A802743|nr:restriction endonuclease subunit S [Streptomyces monashensis]
MSVSAGVDGDRELPAGWAWATLGDLLHRIEAGKSFTCEPRPAQLNEWGVVKVSAMTWGEFNAEENKAVPKGRAFDPGHEISPGDVLVSRANTKAYVGAPVLVGACRPRLLLSDKSLRLVPRDGVSKRWLVHFLRSPEARSYVEAKASGTKDAMRNLSQEALRRMPVPLPPLAEQHRIVEALEEQLSRLEVALKSLESSAARSTSLRRSLLVRAFSGVLLPDNGGPRCSARPLLERVDAQVSAHAGKKRWSQECTPAQEWCRDLPEGWEWRTLGSLALLIQYGSSAKAESSAGDGAVPVIRMGNIQSGEIVLDDVKYLPGGHPDVEPLRLLDGDLLFNRTNSAELVGKSAVYRDGIGEAVFASYLIRCHLADGIDPDWVSAYVNSPGGRKYITSVLSQQVGQANVNSAKLASLPIPVPSAGEQANIMEALREWYRLLGRSDKARETANLRAGQLRKSLLRAAFAGSLVRQSPDDEPAADLLARVTAERAARPEAKRPRTARAKKLTKAPAPRAAEASASAPEPTPAPALAVQQEFDL